MSLSHNFGSHRRVAPRVVKLICKRYCRYRSSKSCSADIVLGDSQEGVGCRTKYFRSRVEPRAAARDCAGFLAALAVHLNLAVKAQNS